MMDHFQIIIQQQQSQLLQQLADSQRQQQELQRRLQEQLNGVTQHPFAKPQVPQLPHTQIAEPQVPQLPTQFQFQEAVEFPLEPPPPPCSTLSGEAGLCRPLVKCITFYAQVPELRRQPCKLQGQELGVCCPLKKRPSGKHITKALQSFI
jgi:peroxidase